MIFTSFNFILSYQISICSSGVYCMCVYTVCVYVCCVCLCMPSCIHVGQLSPFQFIYFIDWWVFLLGSRKTDPIIELVWVWPYMHILTLTFKFILCLMCIESAVGYQLFSEKYFCGWSTFCGYIFNSFKTWANLGIFVRRVFGLQLNNEHVGFHHGNHYHTLVGEMKWLKAKFW